MKVAVFSTKPYDKKYFEQFNESFHHELAFFDTNLNELTTDLTRNFDAVCPFVNDKLDEQVLGLLANNGVKLIALRSAGFNNVDLKAAEANNMKVTRVPAYSPQAVAEHALALILTLNRKTHKAYNRIKEGNFSLNNLIGFNVHNKTVGVIGTGKIGSSFCHIMTGLGCNVLAYDVQEQESLKDIGVTYLSQEELV